ncbi:hypothetical protein [Campylobacter anatolicus]|uniref:hypothetical protein n=1 Tax=Campylobacter anatolicus TaxID=2829105 RepID=UPI001E2EFAF4|nr:hypothetical protein [Campylobacter anatolicus]
MIKRVRFVVIFIVLRVFLTSPAFACKTILIINEVSSDGLILISRSANSKVAKT